MVLYPDDLQIYPLLGRILSGPRNESFQSIVSISNNWVGDAESCDRPDP